MRFAIGPYRWWPMMLAISPLVVLYQMTYAHASGGTKVEFSGRVFAPPPCKINGDQTIDIAFGTVGIKRVDGSRYAVTKTLAITCDPNTLAPVQLQVQGVKLTGANVLRTSIGNLGVALYNAELGEAIPLNQYFDVDRTTSFQLQAIPVKDDDAKPLAEGNFTANATIVSRYN